MFASLVLLLADILSKHGGKAKTMAMNPPDSLANGGVAARMAG